MPQKIQCTVTNVIDHGERVYSIFLKPVSLVPRFRPGQFLHLALDPYTPGDFWPESRVFSIASSPESRDELRITYAVKGQFTSRMEAEIQAGSQVWVKLPYGEFMINNEGDACLLAGGTGITAFTAFLAGLPPEYPRTVHLFYGARRPELLIFQPLAEEAHKRCPSIHPVYMVEQGSEGTEFECGRINLDRVWQLIPEPLSVNYYLAGPPEMLKVLTQGLIQRNVSLSRILTDEWE